MHQVTLLFSVWSEMGSCNVQPQGKGHLSICLSINFLWFSKSLFKN